MEQELPNRDLEAWVHLRPLSDSDGLRLAFSGDSCWSYLDTEGAPWIGVVLPSWRAGWKHRDPDVEDLLGDFFHFASQYVARSRASNIVGAIALTYDRACDFRFEGLVAKRLDGSDQPHLASLIANVRTECRQGHPQPRMRGAAQRRFKKWAEELNALDPFVHRAIFQFWRSRALAAHEFWEDSTNALDSVVSVAAQFASSRLGVQGDVRSQLAAVFSLPAREQAVLDELYRLRSKYGGHPSPSKWWDFAEMYEDFLPESVDVVSHVLGALSSAEGANRIVDAEPRSWSDWFTDNAPEVLSACSLMSDHHAT